MDIYFDNLADDYYERAPLTLIDIGARGGLQSNWRPAVRHLRHVGFEPDPAEHARLASGADPRRTVFINAAVGRARGRLVLNVGRLGGTSSHSEPNLEFLRRFPDPDRYEVVRQVEIETDRLDAVLPRHGIADPDFIKIDTQGAELAILEGAREALERSVLGLEVEVLFAPLYREQPSFGEIDDLLRRSGFQLFDLRPGYWKRAAGARYGGPKGQLVFADVLYLRTEESLQQLLAGIADATERRAKLLRALAVSLLYGYVDYAIEIFEPNRDLLGADLAKPIEAALRSEVPLSARLPHFRGKGWLSHAFYRMHRALFPTFGGWASSGRHIGNVE